MDNKIILTIGRQFGSGGREIGQRLAKELGIGYLQWFIVRFYDGVFFFYGRDVYAL